MLIGGIIIGVVLGLAAGGNLGNLGLVRLRYLPLLFGAVIVRFGTEAALAADVTAAETLRLPLFALAFAMLLVGLWANREQPGLGLAFVGILFNTVAVIANGGHMPIWQPSLVAAGFPPDEPISVFHSILPPALDASFLLHAGPLGDIIPIPIPLIRNVASVGDLFLTAGLGIFLFSTIARSPEERAYEAARRSGQLVGLAGTARLPLSVGEAVGARRVRPETGLAPGLAEASMLDRPLVLGGRGAGLAAPGAGSGAATAALAPIGALPAADEAAGALPRPGTEVAARVRRHPYVQLALNPSFTALWAGQLISLFGDRVHQVALAFLVLGVTNSPVAVAFVFVAATLPNLLLSPIAGTFVDRWNQQDVLVVSDLLRAAIVLLIPIAVVVNILLVYPLVFLMTSISIFFRPARIAVLPRIVHDDELLTANSAMWVGETLADVIGYPLAGLFVAFLGSALPLAFWLDAATYAASAALLLSMVVPPVVRSTTATAAHGIRSVLDEMRDGFRFLRGEATLFANTIQAAIAQLTVGVLTALTPIYARDVVASAAVGPTAAYAFMETAIGVGNLVGGFVLGLIGARFARGRTVIAGYTAWGVCVVLLALTGNLGVAIGLMFGSGVANMVFVIPSQTMFQERTPADMIGRVVGFRFALVFGSMTAAMAVSGLLAEAFGLTVVIGLAGLLTMTAGLAGLLVPAVRDA